MSPRPTGSPSKRPPGNRRPRAIACLFLWLVAIVPLAGLAETREIEDVPFPGEVEAGNETLQLAGLGLLRYRVLFRGYVGGLYLPDGVPTSLTLDDVPKALELYYFWDIKGRFFGEAADELLGKHLPPERVAALRNRLDRLHELYRDVEAGDRYRLTYLPGTGTTLSFNGKKLGTIPGADFATDYFGIWLGSKPLDEAFRDQMFSGLQ